MRIHQSLFGLIIGIAIGKSYAQTTWGVPPWTDISAYAINTYPPGIGNLPRSIAHKNSFISNIQNAIKAKYPNVTTEVRINKENAAATARDYSSTETDNSEFVFSAGHGSYDKLYLYDGFVAPYAVSMYDGNWYPGIQKKFGGWTRWVIMDACLALNHSQTKYNDPTSWIGSAHVILGNHALGWQYIHRSGLFGYYRSEYQYQDFAKFFITNDIPIWVSYQVAVKNWIYFIGGLGIEPAIMRQTGNADNGQYIDFANEQYSKTYNGPFDAAHGAKNINIQTSWVTFGTPKY